MSAVAEANAKHTRFTDAAWYDPNGLVITLGGAGGIGSWLALYLTRIGYTIHLYEMDVLEEHNIGGQLYFSSSLGMTKAEAVSEVCDEMCDYARIISCGKFTPENSNVTDVVFAAFDNMAARKMMFEAWKEHVANHEIPEACCFIDGRMTAETGIVFCVTPDRIEEYEKEFFDDSEVPPEPCSYKATSHNGALISAFMLANLLNFISNLKIGDSIFCHPYKLTYELPSMTIKTTDDASITI